MTGTVTRVSTDMYGNMTVGLEGGQVWMLDMLDPILAKGDSVTIKRGKLGSFLLSTPTGRVHRAHRLQ